MSVNTGISDTISRFNQGKTNRFVLIKLIYTKFNISICIKLTQIGILNSFWVNNNAITAYYKYKAGRCNFVKMELISKLSNKKYWNLTKIALEREKTSASIIILSTKKGLLMDTECLWARVGGEPLFRIFL